MIELSVTPLENAILLPSRRTVQERCVCASNFSPRSSKRNSAPRSNESAPMGAQNTKGLLMHISRRKESSTKLRRLTTLTRTALSSGQTAPLWAECAPLSKTPSFQGNSGMKSLLQSFISKIAAPQQHSTTSRPTKLGTRPSPTSSISGSSVAWHTFMCQRKSGSNSTATPWKVSLSGMGEQISGRYGFQTEGYMGKLLHQGMLYSTKKRVKN